MLPKSYLAPMKVNQSKKNSKRKKIEIADKKQYRFKKKKKLDYKITHKRDVFKNIYKKSP